MRWFLLPLLMFACIPKGPLPLRNLNGGPNSTGSLVTESSGVLIVEPGGTFSLMTTLNTKNMGERPIRVDLTRARVSVDGLPFLACKQAPGTNPADLIATVRADEAGQAKVTCRDIAKPIQKVEFKFHTSGTGVSGEVTIGFYGLGERP
jgi:hypothetical protein